MARLPAANERVAKRLRVESSASSRSERERCWAEPVPAHESAWAKVTPDPESEPAIVLAQRSARSCISGSV